MVALQKVVRPWPSRVAQTPVFGVKEHLRLLLFVFCSAPSRTFRNPYCVGGRCMPGSGYMSNQSSIHGDSNAVLYQNANSMQKTSPAVLTQCRNNLQTVHTVQGQHAVITIQPLVAKIRSFAKPSPATQTPCRSPAPVVHTVPEQHAMTKIMPHVARVTVHGPTVNILYCARAKGKNLVRAVYTVLAHCVLLTIWPRIAEIPSWAKPSPAAQYRAETKRRQYILRQNNIKQHVERIRLDVRPLLAPQTKCKNITQTDLLVRSTMWC